MKKSTPSILWLAVVLSACGGGGGSGGEYQAPYNITLRAEKTQLPVNISGVRAGQGAYAPFSTTLYVHATAAEGRPVPSAGDDTFVCNLERGLDSGDLYYMDGEADHEVEIDNPNDPAGEKISVPAPYRSITLGANAGGNSFHFHASATTGVARITCSILDPRDNKYHSASVDIAVGGGATGQPALLRALVVDRRDDLHGILGTQGNHKDRLPNSQAMQVYVMDDVGQPVPNGNVQVRVLPGSEASLGARLVAGHGSSPTGSSALQLPVVQNVATFSLASGAQPGPIFLEYAADRFDNNVANGIQDPITLIERFDVLEEVAAPLVLPDETIVGSEAVEGTNTIPFSHLLVAQGGLPPYTWTVTGLPRGLSLNASLGVISGTPDDLAGEYLVWLTVRDKNRLEARGSIRLRLHDAIKPEDFAIAGCTHLANAEETCHIATAVTGVPFAYAFTSSVNNVDWSFAGLPVWLQEKTLEDQENAKNGFIAGIPVTENCLNLDPGGESRNDVGIHRFFVTATKKPNAASPETWTSVSRPVSISVIRGNGC